MSRRLKGCPRPASRKGIAVGIHNSVLKKNKDLEERLRLANLCLCSAVFSVGGELVIPVLNQGGSWSLEIERIGKHVKLRIVDENGALVRGPG